MQICIQGEFLVAIFVIAVTFVPILLAYYFTRDAEDTGGSGK